VHSFTAAQPHRQSAPTCAAVRLCPLCPLFGRHRAFSGGVELRIPFATLLKIAAFILLCLIAIRLWPVILMIVIAALIAVMVDPLVAWMAAHGARRGFGIAIVGLAMFGLLAAFVFVIIPMTASQLQQLGKEIPRLAQELSRRVPASQPYIAPLAQSAQKQPNGVQLEQWLTRGLIAGRYALAGLTAMTLTLVFAIYLLIEGRRALEWLVVFAHPTQRRKLRQTLERVRPIVFAYMRGQAITCFLCGGMAIATLTLLHIPAAVPLAVLAFVADLVPVVGTIVMIAPAVLLALMVSPVKALIVLGVYLAYHLIESYLIIPRVYGKEMRLSTLTVLLAVTVGGVLQGALGAVLILPFVAAYPVIEEIWLQRQLGETVDEHERIEER
jgi:predicted PurR-regulated permease PerM